MKIYAEYKVSLPEYSLSYLINGDDSGLLFNDKEVIDDYMEQHYQDAKEVNGHVVIDIDMYEDESDFKEPYFSNHPEFGLPCNVVDAHILILVNDNKEIE